MTRSARSLALLVALAGSPAALAQIARPVDPPQQPQAEVTTPAAAPAESVIDVVFVLDTTSSMTGLIEGAKQKIWSIANTIATAKPRPTMRMGLVAYRDIGDAYVTQVTPLTEDLDAVYAELMKLQAEGGGDGPESVNQALHEGLTKQPWSDDPAALKLIYLVGDCPPHMDYEQDVKYHDTCASAASRGVIINAIQCGMRPETTPVWQEIARLAEGEYLAIEQDGGVTLVATPFDDELAKLGNELASTSIGYGTTEEQARASVKREAGRDIAAAAPLAAQADRAVYFASEAGKTSALGRKELVDDVTSNTVDLAAIPEDQLPPELRSLSLEDRRRKVDEIAAHRAVIQSRIAELSAQRDAYLKQELAKLGEEADDGFDARVTESLRRQAASRGISYDKD